MDVNDLQSELTAMHHIAEALSQLDAPTRGRVLRWMHERFQAGVPALSPAPLAPLAQSSAAPALRIVVPQPIDEALSVTWDEIVEASTGQSPSPDGQSVTGMLHEFVSEFQGIAREWSAACAAPADADDSEQVLSAAS